MRSPVGSFRLSAPLNTASRLVPIQPRTSRRRPPPKQRMISCIDRNCLDSHVEQLMPADLLECRGSSRSGPAVAVPPMALGLGHARPHPPRRRRRRSRNGRQIPLRSASAMLSFSSLTSPCLTCGYLSSSPSLPRMTGFTSSRVRHFEACLMPFSSNQAGTYPSAQPMSNLPRCQRRTRRSSRPVMAISSPSCGKLRQTLLTTLSNFFVAHSHSIPALFATQMPTTSAQVCR
mmetsp:Transcript_23695/g.74154  ORF Transcript_23695/g.74154 Transcript_23695/m.74154 type:complete len:232 (-) Transcript_23695:2929-3624(-)